MLNRSERVQQVQAARQDAILMGDQICRAFEDFHRASLSRAQDFIDKVSLQHDAAEGLWTYERRGRLMGGVMGRLLTHLGADVPAAKGRADSGDLELDLIELFTDVADFRKIQAELPSKTPANSP